MNIYKFETKAQLKSFLVWAFSLLALFLVFAFAFYDMFMDSRAAVLEALNSLPPVFSAMFGINMDILFSYSGYFQFTYTYVALIGAIMASSIALSAFAREKRSKCVDFLFSKPVSREKLFFVKLLSCLTLIIVVNVLFIAASVLSFAVNGQDPSKMGVLILASSSLFFMQLVFLSISILYAVFAPKVRSVSGTATAFGFAGFILSALYSLIQEDFLKYLSPLGYFSPGTVFSTGSFETGFVVTAAAVVAASVALAYFKYCKSDAQAI